MPSMSELIAARKAAKLGPAPTVEAVNVAPAAPVTLEVSAPVVETAVVASTPVVISDTIGAPTPVVMPSEAVTPTPAPVVSPVEVQAIASMPAEAPVKTPSAPATIDTNTAIAPPPMSSAIKSPAPRPSAKVPLTDSDTQERFTEKMSQLASRGMEGDVAQQAQALGLPAVTLKGFPITPDAISQVPEERARATKAVVFYFDGTELRIGAVDPTTQAVKDLVYELSERLRANAILYVISSESLEVGLNLYKSLPKIKQIVKGVEITEKDLEKYTDAMRDFASINATLQRATATDVLAVVIAAALKLNSSDIHIEAEERGIVVRFRVDGMLNEIAVLDREQWKKLISRIKLVASLKINVTSQAQDGRFTIMQKLKKIDVRISTIPTAFGESVVMRLLNPEAISLEFAGLGFRPAVLKKLVREVERPNGMIVTTGPTGSGKTTTLYAVLKRLNTPDVKIITLEDPIEYKVEGLNQSQIEQGKDYTFAKGLRSILRQDPDIVMVGEIRDLETAEIAIQAALTGHLLLSTIHTNDAAGAVPRFLSMGVAPHLLAPALNAIMGQRLVRKLCGTCKTPVKLDEDITAQVKEQLGKIPANSGEVVPALESITWYGPKGCSECNNTGFKGRIGIYEVLIKDSGVEKAILTGPVSEYDMRGIAISQGMVSMAQDGLLKAIDGLTSVEEVRRVAGL